METIDKIYVRHTENEEWLDKLFFYRDEVAIMQERLEEVIDRNPSVRIKATVEHLQNQLIIYNSTIQKLMDEIEADELELDANLGKDPVFYNAESKNHVNEKVEIAQFERSFNELRKELKEFLAKWL